MLVLALAQSIGFLLLPRLMSDIVDKGIVKGDQRAIFETGGLMLLMSSVGTLCAIAGSYLLVEGGDRIRPDPARRDLRARRALLDPPVRSLRLARRW